MDAHQQISGVEERTRRPRKYEQGTRRGGPVRWRQSRRARHTRSGAPASSASGPARAQRHSAATGVAADGPVAPRPRPPAWPAWGRGRAHCAAPLPRLEGARPAGPPQRKEEDGGREDWRRSHEMEEKKRKVRQDQIWPQAAPLPRRRRGRGHTQLGFRRAQENTWISGRMRRQGAPRWDVRSPGRRAAMPPSRRAGGDLA